MITFVQVQCFYEYRIHRSLTSALDFQQQNMLAALPIVASIEFQALQTSQGMMLKETIQRQCGMQGSLLFSKFEFSIKPDLRDLSFL